MLLLTQNNFAKFCPVKKMNYFNIPNFSEISTNQTPSMINISTNANKINNYLLSQIIDKKKIPQNMHVE